MLPKQLTAMYANYNQVSLNDTGQWKTQTADWRPGVKCRMQSAIQVLSELFRLLSQWKSALQLAGLQLTLNDRKGNMIKLKHD